ncbi:MAG: PIN domain-containing protein [Candidatus Woesearchaeota archaeon]
MRYVVDASAWVEYFKGSVKGDKVKAVVENASNEIVVSAITFAELSSFYCKNSLPFAQFREIILSVCNPVNLDPATAEKAGELYVELRAKKPKISTADSIVATVARQLSARILTADKDFANLRNAVII